MTTSPGGTAGLVRKPTFSFDDVVAEWADNIDAVQRVNAQGIVPAFIEPFLIKVMRRAKAELDPVEHAELIARIDWFNAQEAQHFRWHRALNERIREAYPGMAEHEARYEADYERMLAEDSLEQLLAYCEGFESLGLASAAGIVDGDLTVELGDPAPEPVALWRWHLAEEYEHRTVAHDVLRTLCHRNPVQFYVLRLRGLARAMRHIGGAVQGLQDHLVQTYEARTGTSVRRSRLPKVTRRQLRTLSRVLLPTYDPSRAAPPRENAAILAEMAAR